MKTLATIVALSIATAIAAPAFAQTTPTNKTDCEKMAGKKWDDAKKACVSK